MRKILIFLSLAIYVITKELVMIQETFRHGARYPVFPNSSDHSDFAQRMGVVGELTTEGKNMHYLLGKIIYETYWDQLFKGTPYENVYSQSQFYVKSTDKNRTIESAQSHLFGLLQKIPPLQLNRSRYQFALPVWQSFQQSTNISETFQVFQSGPAFHPTAIHTEKRGANPCDPGDFLTKYDVESCPNQKFWSSENFNSDSNLQIMRDPRIKEALGALSNQLGFEVEFEELYKWKDSDTCMKYLGYPRLKSFDDPKYSHIYDFIEVYSTYLQYYAQKDQISAVSTDYFQRTLTNFQSKSSNTSSPSIIIYSGHDTTVAMVLAAMDLANIQCITDHYLNGINNDDTCVWEYPAYTANVLFELWNNNGEFTVRVLVNGRLRKIPFCDYRVECTLGEFRKWVKGFAVSNVGEACGYVGDTKTYYAVIFLMASLIIVFIFYVIFLHAKIRKIDTVARAKREGYMENFEQKVEDKQHEMYSKH